MVLEGVKVFLGNGTAGFWCTENAVEVAGSFP